MSSPEFPTTSSDSTKSESSNKQSIENFLRRTSDGDIKKYMILKLYSISDGERKSNFPQPEKSPAEEITDLESNEIVLGIVKYDRNSPSNQPDKENSSREANKDSSEPRTQLPKLGSLQRLVVKELFKPPSVSNIADELSDETQRTPCPCYPLSTESRREKWHQILDSLAKKYSSRSVSVRTHEFTELPQNTPKVCPNSDKCCQTTFEKTTDSLNKKPATEVDLGIKLLCYLIDAKNLTKTQKKQLGKNIFEKVTMQRSQSGNGSAMISSIVSSAVSTSAPIEIFLQSKDQKEQTPVQNASRGKALIKEMIEEQIQTEEFHSMHVEEAAKTPPKSSPSIKDPVTTRERLPHSRDRKGQTQIDKKYPSRGKAPIKEMIEEQIQTESLPQTKDQNEQTQIDDSHSSRGKAPIKKMIEEQIQTELPIMDVEVAAKNPPKSSPSLKEPVTTRERLSDSRHRKGQTRVDNSNNSRGRAPIKEMIEEQIQTELPTMDVEVVAKTPPKSSPSLKEPVTTRERLLDSRDQKGQTRVDNSNDSRGKAPIKEMIEEQIQTELPTMDVEVATKTPPKFSPSLKEPVITRERLLDSRDQKGQTRVDNSNDSRGKAPIKEMIEEQIQTELPTMDVEVATKTPPKSSSSLKEHVATRESLPQSRGRKKQTPIDNSNDSRGKALIKEMIEQQIQTELLTMDVEVAAKTPPKSSPSLKEPVAMRESLPQSRGRKKQTQIDNSNDSRGKALIKETIEEQIQTEELHIMDVEVAVRTPPKSSPSLKEPVTKRESLPQSRDRKEHKRSKAKTPRKSSPAPEEPVITSEWLNPLTQSEKNYDKKSKSSKSEILPSSSPEHNSRRSSQLNKIDMEIGFLEGIKTLLLQEQEPSRGRRSSASTRKSSKYQSPEEQKDHYNKTLRRISKNLVINGEPTTDKEHSDKHSINEEKKPSSSSSTSGKKKRRSKLESPILTEN